ncbi:hypothetical protein [Paraburkholderia sp. J11-2]|uniref:hypothetical protein n=1 Tax=Paraburkholderia sp. J11-2 TaxID=2805431 RepID=UPI002AB7D285|nr:hypothetical protein [Paraburkholderia sp. J11-2]
MDLSAGRFLERTAWLACWSAVNHGFRDPDRCSYIHPLAWHDVTLCAVDTINVPLAARAIDKSLS